MTKEIELTRGKVALVNDEDYDELSQYNWWAERPTTERDVWYAKRHRSEDESPYNITMHRHLLDPPADAQIDHINGDGLDNRRGNLRLADSYVNQQSRRGPNRNNKVGYLGVSPHGSNFRVQMMTNGNRVDITGWEDPKMAALVYDLWSVDLRGKHGSTNFEVVSHG